ncbi:MAG TPA: 1-phosphofructokinase family hexose kinase [Tepidisphaeraceae bacterium]|jgi:tagatose 6-phosphate kinase|nr:1-phosphofructokinase family hexose kinase [Tepidisphaeraceae bacterium]
MIITLGTTPALQRTMRFESLRVDGVNRALNVHEHASGKSINVARVIHTMRKPCIATGFLGGKNGAFCQQEMESSGIEQSFVEVNANTRICTTLIDQTNHSATELVEEAAAITADDARNLLEHLQELLKRARVLVLAGTIAPGCGQDFYARCASLANSRNVPVILDAKGEALKVALEQKPFVVKPNQSELATTVGGVIKSIGDLQQAIREVVSMGASWVVVTNGAAETVVSNGREFWTVQTPKVPVINPIGSGDALAAGIAMGLTDRKSLPEACLDGIACGAANAMTEQAGHVRVDDVLRLRAQIKLQSSV